MKLKKLGAALLAAGLLLAGCSSNTERKTTVCSGPAGIADQTTFVSEGDKIITQTEHDVYTWEDFGLTEEDIADEDIMTSLLAYYQSFFSDITKGLTITYEVNNEDQTVVFTLTLDYTVADLDELEALGVVDDTDSDYVSLKATISNFESETEGLTCE